MKILVLTEGDAETHDSWSGISRSVLQALRAAGHTVVTGDVDLYGVQKALAAAGTVRPGRRRWGINFRLGALPFRMRSRNARRLVETVGRDADVILQFGATFRVPESVRVPVVFYGDSNIRQSLSGRSTGYSEAAVLTDAEVRAIGRREAAVYGRVAHLFTISERLRRSFIEDFGIPEGRVTTIHAGPNLDVGRIPWPRPAPPMGGPTILFVGRQFHRKGGDLVLRAFERVRERIPDARLVIAGPSDLQVSQPGVSLLGFLDKDTPEGWQKLLDTYAASTVFCLPTRFEAFGIVYLEAMCFGLPCVGPEAWAVPEMIVDGVTGFTFPSEDVEALADRLTSVLREPDRARRMGEAGRERALSHFTWPATIGRMLDVVERRVVRK